MRHCNLCSYKTSESNPKTALEQMADHLTTHNPSPAQWTDAYKIMQADKERAKRLSKQQHS